MMDVQGCHLRIASVEMIDPSLAERSIKVQGSGVKLALRFPPKSSHSADDDSADACSSHIDGWARVHLAQKTELVQMV